jgi:hypothetical protein
MRSILVDDLCPFDSRSAVAATMSLKSSPVFGTSPTSLPLAKTCLIPGVAGGTSAFGGRKKDEPGRFTYFIGW